MITSAKVLLRQDTPTIVNGGLYVWYPSGERIRINNPGRYRTVGAYNRQVTR